MRQETFYGDDPQQVERAARAFGKLVDRVGITEASRIRDARSTAAGSGVPTLAEWFDTYLDKASGLLRNVTDGGREGYRRAADRWILPRLGELPVDHITDEDVRAWMTWLEDQPSVRRQGQTLAAKTVTNHHSLLSQALTAAAARGHLTGNPALGLKATRGRRQRMTILSQDEFAVLLHFIPPKWRPLVLFLAGTGMRWGEVTALTWGDVDTSDPRHATVRIDKAWQKPATGTGRVLGPPKTDAGMRTISVPHALVAQLGPARVGNALVFPSEADTPLWSGSFWSRVWTPAVDAANDPKVCAAAGLVPLGKRPRVHDLRHVHASWLIAAGRPLTYVQRRLGHEKITTTSDTYGHLLPDAMQGDADTIAVVMSGVLPAIEPTAALPPGAAATG